MSDTQIAQVGFDPLLAVGAVHCHVRGFRPVRAMTRFTAPLTSAGHRVPVQDCLRACWAWWNRRADDNLNPGSNDPKLITSLNVGVPELDEICREWNLTVVGTR